MAISEKKMQELDKQLLEIATSKFELFCLIANVDKVQAYVCIEVNDGKSMGQIATALGVSRQSVQQRCKKCKSTIIQGNKKSDK